MPLLWRITTGRRGKEGERKERREALRVSNDFSRLQSAKTMDERCRVLREHFKARFYLDLDEYDGLGDHNAWEER